MLYAQAIQFLPDRESHMAIDLTVLDNAIAEAEAHPEKHFQNNWLIRTGHDENWCGTGGCLAGIIVMQAGAVPEWREDVTPRQAMENGDASVLTECWSGRYHSGRIEAGTIVQTGAYVTYRGQSRYVPALAASLLGVNHQDLGGLFEGYNTLEDIKRVRWALMTPQQKAEERQDDEDRRIEYQTGE